VAVSKLVRNVALVIIVSHAIGVAANAYSLAAGDPRYSSALWLTFMLLKLSGVIAGLLLLRGLRLGALLFGASLAVGVFVALAFTGPYSAGLWVGVGAALLLILAGFGALMRRAWSSLR
jgi:hypothetical protein